MTTKLETDQILFCSRIGTERAIKVIIWVWQNEHTSAAGDVPYNYVCIEGGIVARNLPFLMAMVGCLPTGSKFSTGCLNYKHLLL